MRTRKDTEDVQRSMNKPGIMLNIGSEDVWTASLEGVLNEYRVSQEKISILWEVTVSVILSKKAYMYMCRIGNGF
jgi:hypothetical protein